MLKSLYRLPRRFVRPAVAVFAALMVLGAPTTAHASTTIVDGGGGTGGGGGYGWNGPATVCINGQGWTAGSMTYYSWPGCNGGQATDQRTYCQVGQMVWRFYGPRVRPTDIYTVSHAWSPAACADSSQIQYALFSPNPNDAGLWNEGAPWNVGTGPAGWDPSRRVVFAASPAGGGPSRITSGDLIAYAGNCRDAQGNTNVAQYFEDSKLDDPVAQSIRAAMRQIYFENLNRWGGEYVKSILDATGTRTGPDGLLWLTFNNNQPCSSDFDFMMQNDDGSAVDSSQQRVFGTCSVSLYQMARRYTYANGSSTWAVYASQPLLAANPPANGQNDPMLQSYRGAIASEATGRMGSLPRPYNAAPGENPAQYLANHAQCHWGQGALSSEVANPITNAGVINIPVTVSSPQVAQVGGSINNGARQATITVQTSQVPACTAGCDPELGPFLDAGSVQLNLHYGGAFHSMRQCTTASQLGCDYRIVRTTQPDANGFAQIVVEFYRATPPGETFKLSVSGSASLTWYARKSLIYDSDINTQWACGPEAGTSTECHQTSIGFSSNQTVKIPFRGRFPLAPTGEANFPVVKATPTPLG